MRYCLQALLDDAPPPAGAAAGSVAVRAAGARGERRSAAGGSFAARARATVRRLQLRVAVWLLRAWASSTALASVLPRMLRVLSASAGSAA